MTRIAAMKVAVTADTSRFDAAMGRVRSNLRKTQGQIAGGAGGAFSAAGLGGGLGAGGAMMLRGSPIFMALGALTAALENNRRVTEAGKKDIAEMADLAFAPMQQQEAKFGAQLIGEEFTGAQLANLKRQFDATTMDQGQRRALMDLGIAEKELDALSTHSIPLFTERLIELSRGMNSMQRLAVAEALGGGDAGRMFLRAGQSVARGSIRGAFGQVSNEEIARAMSVEQQRVDDLTQNGIGFQSTLTTIGDFFTGQNSKTNEQLAVLNENLRMYSEQIALQQAQP